MATEPTAEDQFGSFFDQLETFAAENKPVPAGFSAAVEAAEPPPEAVAEAVEPAPEAAVEATDPGSEAVPEAVTEPVVKPAAQPDKGEAALLERIAAAIETRQPQPAPQQSHVQQPKRLYSDEEVALLNAFEKDWPEHAKVLQMVLGKSNAYTQAQILAQVGTALTPQLESLEVMAEQQQRTLLREAIPDYSAVRDKVVAWATNDPNIPGYLRDAYGRVIREGDVGEIKHLTDTWRQATGAPAAAQTTPVRAPQAQSKPAATMQTELSEAAKQAARSLAPVATLRQAVVTSTSPQDFDGAFEHFSAAKS